MQRLPLLLVGALLAGCNLASPSFEMSQADGEIGQAVYQKACARCHDSGQGGAQRIGDVAGWQARLARGIEQLEHNSIVGLEGPLGSMPPRGGVPELSDREVALAVRYLIGRSR